MLKKLLVFATFLLSLSLFSCEEPHIHVYDGVTQVCECGEINPLAIASVGDARFLSLQDAVDFVKNSGDSKSDETNTIKLIKDASGNGVSVDGITEGLTFDFRTFTYTINGSIGFVLKDTDVIFTGGKICVDDAATASDVLTITGGSLSSTSSFAGSIQIGAGTVVTLTGGVVTVTGAVISDDDSLILKGDLKISVPTAAIALILNSKKNMAESTVSPTIIELHNHSWNSGTVVVSPTCTETGEMKYLCTTCGETDIGDIPAKGHTASHTEFLEETCTEDGNIEYWYCSECKKYFLDEACSSEITNGVTIKAKGHSATYNSANAETCTEDGNIENWYCSSCEKYFSDSECSNEIKTDVILKAKGHSTTHTAAKAETCTEDGNIEYWYCSECKKYFSDDGCTLETVGGVVIKAKGHNATFTAALAPSCTEKGHIEYWYCPDCEKYFSDGVCSQEIVGDLSIDETGHSWDSGTVTKDSTCVETGVRTYTCISCSGTKTETIAKKAHSMTHTSYKSPTCTDSGITENWYCSECKIYYSNSTGTSYVSGNNPVIPELGHDWKIDGSGNHYCARTGCECNTPHQPTGTGEAVLCDCDCSATETHYHVFCDTCNCFYAVPDSESIKISTGGYFEIDIKSSEIICADLVFEDYGTYAIIKIKDNPGSVVSSLETCMCNEKILSISNGQVKIKYSDFKTRTYRIVAVLTSKGNINPITITKIISR